MNDFYGNPYPFGQQPFYQQPLRQQMPQPVQQPMQQPMQQSTDDRIFVPNEAAANAYMVVPGGFVRLWDSNQQVFYEKQAGADGRQYPMMTYDYKLRQAAAPAAAQDMTDFVRRSELDELKKQIEALRGENHDA